jgi:hypothetical protein
MPVDWATARTPGSSAEGGAHWKSRTADSVWISDGYMHSLSANRQTKIMDIDLAEVV